MGASSSKNGQKESGSLQLPELDEEEERLSQMEIHLNPNSEIRPELMQTVSCSTCLIARDSTGGQIDV